LQSNALPLSYPLVKVQPEYMKISKSVESPAPIFESACLYGTLFLVSSMVYYKETRKNALERYDLSSSTADERQSLLEKYVLLIWSDVVETDCSLRSTRSTMRFKRKKKTDLPGLKKLEKELKHFCTVGSIPGFRTSKLHADSHKELTYQFALRKCKDEVVRRVKIYSNASKT
ncbi:hypothetical protein PHPALM_15417, partial [Phytophthora palmivora]